MVGFPNAFYNPLMAALYYSIDIKIDIDSHQYIPGVFPILPREFYAVTQHSTHHFGRVEPYSFAIELDRPGVSDELRKRFKILPEELRHSIRLDEQLTGFKWDNAFSTGACWSWWTSTRAASPTRSRLLPRPPAWSASRITPETRLSSHRLTTTSRIAIMAHERPGKRAKVLKIAALSLLALFVAYEAVFLVWTHSGSNEWKLVHDQDGIKLWTLKTPGVELLKVKGEMRTTARLASVVAILEDTEVPDKSVGIDKVNVLERKDTELLYMAYHQYEHELPAPIGRREFILQAHHSQDPVTHDIVVNFLAAPNKLPPKAGVVRIKHLNNIWTLSPLENGEVKLLAIVDMDLGGNVPYFLKNVISPMAVQLLFESMRKLSTEQRFANAQVSYIRELGET